MGIPLAGAGIPDATSPSISRREYVPRRLGVRNSVLSSSKSASGGPPPRRLPLRLTECPCKLPPSELCGRPSGVRAPDRLARLMGRGGGIMSVRLTGRAMPDDMLARELGRDSEASESPAGWPRFGSGPNESRLTPEVLSLGTCFVVAAATPAARALVGVVSSPCTDGVPIDERPVVVVPRLRERMVTLDGTLCAPCNDERGEDRGGVLTGAGSLERADCTRASRRCICAVSERICESELLCGGSLCDVDRGAVVVRGAGVLVAGVTVATRAPGGRLLVDAVNLGLGVTLWSAEGSRDFRGGAPTGAGVFGGPLAAAAATFGSGTEASDMGGDGGSRGPCGAPSSTAARALASGGVVMSGELAVEPGESSAAVCLSKVGDSSTETSVEMCERWWRAVSCLRTLSWSSSASILRSASSSRRRWASMRSCSRSCSPILISSSIKTPRSIAMLYFDSRSSSEEVVLRACRSKSSLATSVSRSFSCRVRLASRRVVISFSSMFWALAASLLDSLYLRCCDTR